MSQIFQKPIPSSLLFNFIEPYCDKTDNNYLLFMSSLYNYYTIQFLSINSNFQLVV